MKTILIYLVLIFPLFVGIVVGCAGWVLIRVGKARGGFVISVATVLAVAATVLGLHFGDYLRFLSVLEPQVPGIRAKMLSDPAFFFRFVQRQAEEGVVIGKAGINLGLA